MTAATIKRTTTSATRRPRSTAIDQTTVSESVAAAQWAHVCPCTESDDGHRKDDRDRDRAHKSHKHRRHTDDEGLVSCRGACNATC